MGEISSGTGSRQFTPSKYRGRNIMLAGEQKEQFNTFSVLADDLYSCKDRSLVVLDYDGSLYDRYGSSKAILADFKSQGSVIPDFIAPFIFNKNNSTAQDQSKQIAPYCIHVKVDRTSNDMFWTVSTSETVSQYIEYLIILAQNTWLNNGTSNIFREFAARHEFLYRYMTDMAYGNQNITSSAAKQLISTIRLEKKPEQDKQDKNIEQRRPEASKAAAIEYFKGGAEDLNDIPDDVCAVFTNSSMETSDEIENFTVDADEVDEEYDLPGMPEDMPDEMKESYERRLNQIRLGLREIKKQNEKWKNRDHSYPKDLILPKGRLSALNKEDRESWNVYVLEQYAKRCGMPSLFNSTLKPSGGNQGTTTPVNILRTINTYTGSYFDLVNKAAAVPSDVPDLNIGEWMDAGSAPLFIVGSYTGQYCRALGNISIQAVARAAKQNRRYTTILVPSADYWGVSGQIGDIHSQSDGYVNIIYGVTNINKAARNMAESPMAFLDDMHVCADITLWHPSHNGTINDAFRDYVSIGHGRYQPKDLYGGLVAVEEDGDVSYPVIDDVLSGTPRSSTRIPFKESAKRTQNWFTSGVMSREDGKHD